MKQLILFLIATGCLVTSHSQTTSYTVSGRLTDKTSNEPVSEATITIKETGARTLSDASGRFKVVVNSLPVTVLITHVSFQNQELIAAHTNEIHITLSPSSTIVDGIVLVSKGIPTRIRDYSSSAEFIGLSAIRNLPTTSIYDATIYKKGIDLTTSSLTFKTFSTRGFNGSGSSRVNQITDGMDNQAPGLNFSVGNFVAPTDLDIESTELLPGASSALYGPGGMNGTILMNTKNPFKYQGLSFQARQGVMHIDKSQRGKTSPYYDYAFRWAHAFNDKWAFKIGAQYVSAQDWLANDSSNYLRTGTTGKLIPGTRSTDPGYDGVNVYGDETNVGGQNLKEIFKVGAALILFQNPSTAPDLLPLLNSDTSNLGSVSRTGYAEKDIIDPQTKNIKLNGAIHYKVSDNIEAQLMGYWATGNTVYTDDNRYALKGIKVGQYKIELKHKNWFVRGYTTQEDAGEAYSATIAAQYFNEAWKQSFDAGAVAANPMNFMNYWYGQYALAYWTARLQGADVSMAHNTARSFADQGRPEAGSANFNQIFDQVRKTPIPNGGLFKEKSQLWMSEGQYRFSKFKFADVIIGGNYKQYILDSDGTIFIDTAKAIKTKEIGAYAQIIKSLFNDKLTLTFSGRYDKNENFKGQFTPRMAALLRVAKDHNLRFSYQTAYRFPSNLSQWIRLDVGSDYLLLGGLPWVMDYMSANKYSVHQIKSSGEIESTPYQYKEFKPETMRSFELGYKALIKNSLLIDAYAYVGKYEDFVGRIGLYQPATGNAYSIVVNSTNKVKTHGFGVGLDYRLKNNYSTFFNVYSDVITDVPEGFKSYFNTPKYRLNLGLANSGLGKKEMFGFNVMMRWQDKINWEGELANGPVKAFATIDAQLSYKLPKIKSSIRIGGTNITNKYYQNAFANPRIGGLYYTSFIYNL